MPSGTKNPKPILTPEEALQAVIKNAPVSLSVTDASGHLLFVAGRGLELLGVDKGTVVGMKLAEAFPEEKRLPELMKRVLAGETVNAVLEVRGRMVDVWMSPVRDQAEKVTAAISIATDVTERERLVRKMEETGRVLSLAEKAARFGLWYSDPSQQGKLIWSDGAHAIFGVPKDAFDGKVETFFKLIHPEDADRIGAASRAALAGEVEYNVEHRIVRPDGEIRWVHQEAEVIFGADGKPLQMVGMVQDITDRKRAEEARLESEGRYLALIETSPLGVAIHQDAKFIYVNKAFADIVGVERRETLIGDGIYKVVHPDYREIVRKRVEDEVGQGRNAPMIEEKFLRPDGGTVDVEVITAPIMLGGRVAAVTYVHDIARRKAREAELRASEERFEMITRATNDVIYDWDIPGRRLWWNENLKTMLGHDPKGAAEDIGWWEEQMHPDDRKRVLDSLTAAFDGGASVWTGEYRFRKPDGGYVDALDRGYIIRDAAGKAVRVVGSLIDLTSRKRMEAVVRESEERYRTLFELADDAIFVADAATGAIVDCNRKAEALVGRPREEILTLRQPDLHPPGLGDRYAEYFRTYIATGKVVPEQMYAARKDGTSVPIKLNASMAKIGGRTLVTGVFHDVTEEVRAAEALTRRNQELEQFVKVTTGREIRMMELKRENEDLRRKLEAKK